MMPATHTSGTVAARQLPAKPNLEHLKNEAKQRLEALRASAPAAKLAEAQHQLAREYGFANWRELKADIEARSPDPSSAMAQAALGDWIGKLAGDHRFAVHLRPGECGALAVTVDHPSGGFFDLVAEDVVLEGEHLSFSTFPPMAMGPQQQVYYEAQWDSRHDRWTGAATLQGVTVPIELERGTWPPAPVLEGLHGFWDSRLETKDGLIRLIVRFKTDRHGTYAWLDSPDRNLLGRPAVSISRQDRDVTVVMQTIRIEGRLSDDGQTIDGRFVRGEITLPLTLIRRPPGAAPPLPQRAPAIELTPQALAKFAGRYAIDGGPVVTMVTARDGRLWFAAAGGEVTGSDGERRVQAPGGPPQDLLPSSPTKFFYRIFDATVDFEADAEGAVTGFVQRYMGRETRAKRLG